MRSVPGLTRRLVGATLLAAVLVATAGALAWWQYDAWQARRAAEAVDLTGLPAVPLASVMGPDDPFPGADVGRPVAISGTWLPDATVLVSDRESDGEQGYWIVTPLTTATGSAMPVVRGWTARRDDVPPPPTGEASLTGYLQPSEGRTVTDDDPDDDVLPQLRTASLLQRVDRDLYGAYVVDAGRAGAVNDGSRGLATATVDQVPQVGRFTALRNLLYAIEWVVFGAFAAFVWWRFVREERERRGGRQPGEPVADPVASRS